MNMGCQPGRFVRGALGRHSAFRRKKAKRKVRSGYGDKGDR